MDGKRILITGAAGSVGSELVRQLAPKNEIWAADIDETGVFDLEEESDRQGYNVEGAILDVRNKEDVEKLIDSIRPQIVFHAAAYKHVTMMERYPKDAVKTNIEGTMNVANASFAFGVEKFVFISTDKVVNATSIMGSTKKVAENYVRSIGYTAVRFGNVLGSRGSVIPIWQKQLDAGLPLTITDERMTRYFMSMEEACDLVIQAAEIGEGGELICLDMGEQKKVIDLAKEILHKADSKVGTKVIGIRQGESLDEKLMTEEEEKKAIKQGRFYIIK